MDEPTALRHLVPPAASSAQNEAARKTWREKVRAVAARSEFTPAPLQEAAAEVNPDAAEAAATFMKREDAAPYRRNWEIRMIDLTAAVAIQKSLVIGSWHERLTSSPPRGPSELFEICFPRSDGAHAPMGVVDGGGIAYSSYSPNLRVAARTSMVQQIPVGDGGEPRQARFVGFEINFGSPFVHAVEHHGRLILRNGYHRCYSLLALGIARVPCLFASNAKSAGGECSNDAAFFNATEILGPRPPMVRDFHDPGVAHLGTRAAMRKVVRIVADEYYVEA